jgi:hypothetical protein
MIAANHPFARPSLNVLDEDGNEHCTCGRIRSVHPDADPRPASMPQPVTFDDDGDSARRVRFVPVDEAEDDW